MPATPNTLGPLSEIPALEATGLMSGQDPSQAMGAFQDPRMEQVLNSASAAAAPTPEEQQHNANLAWASAGADPLTPLGALGAGAGAELKQRNEQKSLQAQYLPTITQALLQQEMIKAQQAQFGMIMNGMRGLPGSPTGAAPAPGASGAGAPVAGASGGLPPSPSAQNAGGVPAAQGAPAAAGGLDFSPGGRHNPQGQDPGTAFANFVANPAKYLEFLQSFYAPTEETKGAIQSGGMIDPRVANALKIMGLNKPESLRGPVSWTPLGGFHAVAPQALPGYTNIVNRSTGEGVGAAPMGGGPQMVTGSAAAHQEGVNQQSLEPYGWDANGNQLWRNKAQLVAQTNGQQPNGGAPPGNGRYPGAAAAAAPSAAAPTTGAGAAGAAGAGATGNSLGTPVGTSPADIEAAKKQGAGAGEQWNIDSSTANSFPNRQFMLNKALTGLQNADTGPGSETVQQMRSFLLAQSPQWLQKYLPDIGVDQIKVANYDEVNKYLTQAALTQAGSMGQGTNEKLAATLTANPSTHISNLASQDVVRAMMGLERMNLAKVREFSQAGVPTSQYQNWANNKWNPGVNPQVYIWNYLPQDKQKAAFAAMTPQQRTDFQAKYTEARQKGYIPPPGQ